MIGASIKGIGSLLGKTGEKIQTSVIRPNATDLADGFSIKNVNKYKVGGSLTQTIDKTQAKLSELSSQLSHKIEAAKTPVDLNDIYIKTTKRLLGNKMESFGANTKIDNALENLRKEIISVSGENGLVNLSEAQTIKRAAGHFGSWQYGLPDPESKAIERVYNIFYNEMKKTIEETAPTGVKEINKQLSELIPIMNAVIRRLPVAERNRVLSLQDMMTLTGAVFEPGALGLTLASFISKSGRAGKIIQSIGEGLTKIKGTQSGIGTKGALMITNQPEK